jgi:hypothetical protein
VPHVRWGERGAPVQLLMGSVGRLTAPRISFEPAVLTHTLIPKIYSATLARPDTKQSFSGAKPPHSICSECCGLIAILKFFYWGLARSAGAGATA